MMHSTKVMSVALGVAMETLLWPSVRLLVFRTTIHTHTHTHKSPNATRENKSIFNQ